MFVNLCGLRMYGDPTQKTEDVEGIFCLSFLALRPKLGCVLIYTDSVTHFFLAFSVELQGMCVMLKSSLELLRLFSNVGVSCAC